MHELFKDQAWATTEDFFLEWMPRVMSGHIDRFIKKQTPEDEMARVATLMNLGLEASSPVPVEANLLTDNLPFQRDPQSGLITARVSGKNIAIIPIVGPLTKYSYLCNVGMQAYQGMINRANNTPSIDGLVLVMDSPGGTIDGTPELAMAVKNSAKPVGVFGDSTVASAALWIGSQADVIIGNKNNPTEFGSIGVFAALKNFSKMIEAGNHPDMEIITAPQSTEKVPYDPGKPMTDEVRSLVKEKTRPMAQMIIDSVKAGRGDKLDTKAEGLFAGRMFDSYKAKQIGLIDGVGTLQTALNKVAEIAKERKKAMVNSPQSTVDSGQSTSKEGITKNANMKFPKLSSLFSGEAWGKALSAFTDDEKPLEAAEQKVADMESNLTKVTGEKAVAEARATAAEAKTTELTTQVSTLTGEKATLEKTVADQKIELAKKPTGQATTVLPGKGEEGQVTDTASAGEGKQKYMTSVDQERADLKAQQEQLKLK